MPLTIPQKTLAELVGIAAKISTGKTTVAILECIKIRFGGGGISVQTTDMDNWIMLSTPDFSPKGCETAIIPCKQFHSIVSAIDKDQAITLSTTEKRLVIKTENSKYQFGLQDKNDWPDFKWNEKVKPINIKAGEFADVLRFIMPSCSHDDTRHYLEGVHISVPEKKSLRFCGCDGHQLSHAIMDIAGDCEVPDNGVILPHAICGVYVELLNRADPDTDISLEVTESKCRFEFAGEYKVSLTGRLVDGTYPDIDRVVPYKMEPNKIVFPRDQVIGAIRRIAPMVGSEKGGPLKLEFTGDAVKLTTKSAISDGEETIAVDCGKHSGSITLSISKIHSVMQAFDGNTVTVMLGKKEMDAVIFADTDEMVTPKSKRFAVLMPMRG